MIAKRSSTFIARHMYRNRFRTMISLATYSIVNDIVTTTSNQIARSLSFTTKAEKRKLLVRNFEIPDVPKRTKKFRSERNFHVFEILMTKSLLTKVLEESFQTEIFGNNFQMVFFSTEYL